MVSAMTSQTAAAIVMLVTDGPPYGDANDRPMPEPRATMMNVTAVAANAPAMAALQDKGDLASPGATPTIAVSVMQQPPALLLARARRTPDSQILRGRSTRVPLPSSMMGHFPAAFDSEDR